MTPSLPPQDIKHATSDFPRRHRWVQGFTLLNGLAIPVNLAMGSWVGAAFSVVFLIAAVSAWRATAFFTAAHESGNKAAMFDGLERLEHYYRLSTLGLVAGAAVALLAVVVLVLVALGILGPGFSGAVDLLS